MDNDEIVVTVTGSPVRAYRADRAPAGPALVLLHGGGVDSARLSWEPVWPALAQRFTVVAPDLPGYGASVLGDTPPTLVGYGSWLDSFLDVCELPRVLLVGLSLGGGIALRTALDRPSRVYGMVLCAPYGISRRTPGGRMGYLVVRAPGVTALSNALLRRNRTLLRRSLRTVVRRPGGVTDQLVTTVAAELTRDGSGIAWSGFQRNEVLWSGARTYLGEDLRDITQPTVLLSGELDQLVPPDDVRAAATRLPRGRFVSVPGAGHWLPRDAPEQLTAEIASISRSVDAA
jgi:pimeloyl-ACP methyl ester carboxylesterase